MSDLTYWTDEHIQEVIAVYEDWFQAIEDGTASQRLPDPNGKRFSTKEVDDFINTIDQLFEYEVRMNSDYHGRVGMQTRGKPMNHPADFNRLEGASREAFMQDIVAKRDEVQLRATGSYAQMRIEAIRNHCQ